MAARGETGRGDSAACGALSELVSGDVVLGDTRKRLCCRHVIPLARAFGDLVSPDGDGSFAIGYDVRASSHSLAEAVSLGLRSGGHHVIHIGACTAPRLQWYVADEDLAGGVMLAGGNAPADWNGLQFYGPNAASLPAARLFESAFERDLNRLFARACTNVVHHDEPLQAYAAQLRQRLRPSSLFKLCVDAGNGLVGREIEAIVAHYRHLRLWRMAFKPDAGFPAHGPDPFAPEAIAATSECVRRNGCDLGVILDADGETLSLIDETGARVPPEAMGVLLALRVAARHPDKAVLLGRDTPAYARAALADAGLGTRTFSGGPRAAYAGLREEDACFYFDAAGHYGLRDFPAASNALLALIELINHLTENATALSQVLASLNLPPRNQDPDPLTERN